MKCCHFGTFCMEICQNNTVLALYVYKFAKTILFWPKKGCNKYEFAKTILFWHQKMESIVMKCYCFSTFCMEICQNNTVLGPKIRNYFDKFYGFGTSCIETPPNTKKGSNKYKCAEMILFQHQKSKLWS